MATVNVLYFAVLQEQRGLGSEEVRTQAASLGELYDELQAAHGFTLPRSSLRVARNDRFCGWDETPMDADRVVFIPPVAGG